MSGSIPLSFSTLTPLIISRETNAYYQFKNVIEYDKDSTENIVLENIDFHLIEQEREDMLNKNVALFDKVLS